MSYTATPSRLTVLLLTDIVGSTDLKTRLGLAEYARRLSHHDQVFKRLISQTPHAELLKDTGDGYFASFATTSDAVRVALRFQQALHDQPWADDPLRVRIGIHVGEVVQMDNEETGKPKIVGLAADLVSRVTNLAKGGQILLTRFAFNEARQFVSAHPASLPQIDTVQVEAQLELKWIAHGPYQFKGTDEPVEIYEVGVRGIAPLSAPPDGEQARRAVAVGEDETLGWRPAIGLDVPERPQWILEQRLGEGGFGEVWLARHRALGNRRVFKFCFDADRLRSFKRELTLFRLLQESLGDRPDIARIYEVKLDEPPYFLESEYTEGGNLQDWSDMEGGIDKVSLGTRLDIVARIADAAAAAHSVGVLHKDIKPSNILIALEDGQPRPRLADFGIGIVDRSRLQQQQHPITLTGFTVTGDEYSSQTGTRLYIPPEVLVGGPFTVQGDVYALGVLLYQMIIADLNRPLAAGWERDVEDELLREDIAACVDGDPARRLTSAADLARRLRSLGARRDWKIREEQQQRIAMRRQRVGRMAIATAAAMLILFVGAGLLAWREWSLRQRAERAQQLAEDARAGEADQRAVADAVGQFLMDMILSVSPDTREGRDVTMVQALDVAEKQLESREWHPEVEAYLRKTLGSAYRALGDARKAEPHVRKAAEMLMQLKGESHPDTHDFRGELAMTLYDLGDLQAAEALLRDVVEGLKRTRGPEDPLTLTYLSDHALALLAMERLEPAESIIRYLVETYTRQFGEDHEKTLNALNTYAGLQYQRGQYVQAVEAFGKVYESRRRIYGEDHSMTLLSAHNYSSLLYRSGKVEQGAQIMQRVLESQKRVMGPEHPRTLDAMLNLSQMLRAQERDDEAIVLLKDLLEIRNRKFGPEHPDTLHAAGMLGGVLSSTGRASEAEPLLRQTLQLQRKLLPEDDTQVLNAASALAVALENQNKFDEAEALHRDVLERSIRRVGEDHPTNLTHRLRLGRCLVKMNRLDEAEQILLAGLKLAESPSAPNARMHDAFAGQLAAMYEAWGRPQDAQQYRQMLAATQPSTAPTTLPTVSTE